VEWGYALLVSKKRFSRLSAASTAALAASILCVGGVGVRYRGGGFEHKLTFQINRCSAALSEADVRANGATQPQHARSIHHYHNNQMCSFRVPPFHTFCSAYPGDHC
jgi:hypothetical protein